MDSQEPAEELPTLTPNYAGWASFEARVRGRRFARVVEQARAAIDQGRIDDARAALEEARTLSADAPEIVELDQRIVELEQQVTLEPAWNGVILRSDPPEIDVVDVESDPGWLRLIAGMAAVTVLLALVGFGLVQILHTSSARQLLESRRSTATPDVIATDNQPSSPAEPVATAAGPQVTERSVARGSTTPDATAQSTASAPLGRGSDSGATDTAATRATPSNPASASNSQAPVTSNQAPITSAQAQTPASRQGQPRQETQTASRAVTAPTSDRNFDRLTPERSGGSMRLRLPSAEPTPPLPTTAAPTEPVIPAVTPPIQPAVIDTTAHTLAAASDAVAPVPQLDVPVRASRRAGDPDVREEESARIRTLLSRYETAYNKLDAKAASSVWPGVNQSALNRAFDGLLSQRVSLGLCDITVIGDIAGASCAGKARWEPKVGGGLQTADRYWKFNLRKTDDGWKIQEIQVR